MTEVRKRGSPHRHQVVVVKLDDDTQAFIERLVGSSKTLNAILKITKEILRTMPTKEELNAGLDAVVAKVNKIGSDLSAELQRLNDLIAAGSDLTESMAKVQAIADQLEAIDATLPEQTPTA